MNLELLNLVKAKHVARDADWLCLELCKMYDTLVASGQAMVCEYLMRATGFATPAKLHLAGKINERIEVSAYLLAILIRVDYDKLMVENQPEAEHAEILAKLTEIVNHPELAAKIQITITTK